MNRDDIVRMAREADEYAVVYANKKLSPDVFHPDWHSARDEHFANLVAAAEREACIKVCLEQKYGGDWSDCADAIRARGEEPKRHPGYIMGDHWLQAAYTRVCTGEDIRNVMADYGWYP
jgi:hypothetical protein